jgi:hypothetical protein
MQTNGWVCVALVSGLIGCGDSVAPAPDSVPDARGAGNVARPAMGGRPGSAGSGSRPRPAQTSGAGGGGGRPSTGAGGTGGANAPGGAGGKAGDGMTGAPQCPSDAPAEFEPNPDVGPGGSRFTDSPRFRVYGNAPGDAVKASLDHLEAAYSCFTESICFRSTGLSVRSEDGAYYKLNIYSVGTLPGAAGVMHSDERAGLAYLEVVNDQLATPGVTVHEFGHALAYTEYNWVDQIRTGAWWETVANWVADTYLTSTYCEAAREHFGVQAGRTIINLDRVIGDSHLLIVSDQNYYEAWPFLTYLTNNPDGYPGLGRMAIPEMMRNHPGNNETPLHVLERVAKPITAQTILGRYWARMAYLDIGHPGAQAMFFQQRDRLNFANLEPAGDDTFSVRANRRPMYGGANIIPLEGTGDVAIEVTSLGNGLPGSDFTATLSIRAASGAVRYVDLPEGTGTATLASDEEASLVVVNTPDQLYQYDAFQTEASSPESAGLNYRVRITGAVPAN